jgi:hypothetical protein
MKRKWYVCLFVAPIILILAFTQNFSDYIRGVERFNDPFSGKEVELPAGYGYAWTNNLGEYVVTSSLGYNPNVGSNLHWEPLPVAK